MLIILIFVFLFGLIIGSFLNCLIWRLHKEESLLGRSYCPKCRKQIAWYDNIPVVSFILLGGKCRSCGKAISWQYPTVEMTTGILFVLAYFLNYDSVVQLLRDWFIIAVIIVIFIYDLRWYLILDIVTLPACVVVLITNLLLGYSWRNLLISGIIGCSFFLIQFIISRGKWIGGGDLRLGLLMGLALGWPNVVVAILLSYFIGSIIGLGLIFSGRKQWSSQVPLGVFLSVGAIIALFWGEKISGWYLGLFYKI